MVEKLLGYPRYWQDLETLERCYTNKVYKEEYKDYTGQQRFWPMRKNVCF